MKKKPLTIPASKIGRDDVIPLIHGEDSVFSVYQKIKKNRDGFANVVNYIRSKVGEVGHNTGGEKITLNHKALVTEPFVQITESHSWYNFKFFLDGNFHFNFRAEHIVLQEISKDEVIALGLLAVAMEADYILNMPEKLAEAKSDIYKNGRFNNEDLVAAMKSTKFDIQKNVDISLFCIREKSKEFSVERKLARFFESAILKALSTSDCLTNQKLSKMYRRDRARYDRYKAMIIKAIEIESSSLQVAALDDNKKKLGSSLIMAALQDFELVEKVKREATKNINFNYYQNFHSNVDKAAEIVKKSASFTKMLDLYERILFG